MCNTVKGCCNEEFTLIVDFITFHLSPSHPCRVLSAIGLRESSTTWSPAGAENTKTGHCTCFLQKARETLKHKHALVFMTSKGFTHLFANPSECSPCKPMRIAFVPKRRAVWLCKLCPPKSFKQTFSVLLSQVQIAVIFLSVHYFCV